jgi:hypothetical protein
VNGTTYKNQYKKLQQYYGPKLYARLIHSWGWHHLKEPVYKIAAILWNKIILVTNLQLNWHHTAGPVHRITAILLNKISETNLKFSTDGQIPDLPNNIF